jgi:hypothetical protein
MDPGVYLAAESLELVLDLSLGLAGHLAPDAALAVWGEA